MSLAARFERTDPQDLGKHLAIRAGILLLVFGIVWLLRPLFHSVLYRVFYSPGGALIVGIPLVCAVVLFLLPPFRTRNREGMLELAFDFESGDSPLSNSAFRKYSILMAVFGVALVTGILLGAAGGLVEERTLAEETMADSAEIDGFPEVNQENARVAPRAVSDIQTRGSVSYRTHRLGTSDIARAEDGTLAWSYAIEPDDTRNRLFENQRGVVIADMTTMEDREITAYDESEFEVGEGMALHRSANWNLIKSDFHAQYRDDPVEFTHDGEPYMYYPKTGHEWRVEFAFGFIPVPHTVPVWEGGALVHTDGTIEHLSPEQAQTNEILEGQRLYPLYNTERQMESLGFRNGIINQMGVIGAHEDQVEVAGMPSGAGNDQPFVIDLAGEQMSYVTAMEPHGEDTRGLDEVWFVNAETGEPRYFGSGSENLFGPERAMGIVRSEDSRTGWGSDFEVVEPVPVFVDDELWWHSKVVPVDNTDITRNVFVNADSGEAVEVHSTSGVRSFVAGTDVDEIDDAGETDQVETEPTPADPEIAYEIVITDSDGEEIERIEVGSDEEPQISIETVTNETEE